MADISKIKALNGTTYNIKDATARNELTGKVNGAASSSNGTVAIFDGTTGKTIKDSGFTIEKSVPSTAVFTDTRYTNATTSASGLMSAADKVKLNSIPNVTASDNGKVLRVVNGAWAAATIPVANGVDF